MGKREEKSTNTVIVDYKSLGTITLDQLIQAVWEDIQALKDHHGVEFVTNAQIRIPVTNEYGDHKLVRHLDGRIMRRIDTHYYRPACLDYRL